MSILIYIGGILLFVGWIWNIIASFKTGGTLWGILNIFFQPLVGIISAAMKKTQWAPVGVMILGLVFYLLGGGMAAIRAQY